MAQIPLIDLRAQYESIRPEINKAIQSVLDRGQFILGPEVKALEKEIAAYYGTRHAVAVTSGTDALELSLRACGIGEGDEVLTTAFSFFATAEAVVAVGAKPVFVDIEPETYTIDVAQMESHLTPRTRAIIPVHLYGHPCDMAELLAFAKAHHLKVIEDCAQAIGASINDKQVGSFGHTGAFSFFPSKNLGGYGDGGIVTTDDAATADSIRLLRAHGSREKYRHLLMGTNSRLDELQAAILRVKLRRLDAWNDARRKNAHAYTQAFRKLNLPGLAAPVEKSACRAVYHLYCLRLTKRDAVKASLTQAGIGNQVAYPGTLPEQPALASFRRNGENFPQAEKAAREVLALPLYAELSAQQIEQVVSAVARALDS